MNPRRSHWLTLTIAVSLCTATCGGGSPTRPSDPTPTPDLPRAYLERLISVMQENSINRLTIARLPLPENGAAKTRLPPVINHSAVLLDFDLTWVPLLVRAMLANLLC
jgi:hypothetical protein